MFEKRHSSAVQVIERKGLIYVIVLEHGQKREPIGPFVTVEQAKSEKALWKERLGLG
ncbi:hypothetical protein [Phyllobacterium sp. SB3]|uniref:hypothetical protein n=1 Tax=Phyllobacterium sp. SB3 TaxID=3156073 RepID=UPI0032AF10B2